MASRPDRAFRIADARRPILDGMGAFLVGARWSSPGRRIIYAADTFGTAMLDLLVHTSIGRIPSSHKWIEIFIPDTVSVERADETALPGWDSDDSPVARLFGDEWFDSGRSLILIVPSVVTNGITHNLLINQNHRQFPQLTCSPAREVAWDARLFTNR